LDQQADGKSAAGSRIEAGVNPAPVVPDVGEASKAP
jgi:hypothetical protein